MRYFDTLTGKIYLLNHEFRNNIDYAQIYDINNEVREQSNNNLNRMNKVYRPVEVNQDKFAGVGPQPQLQNSLIITVLNC